MDSFAVGMLTLIGVIGLIGTTNHVWATLAEYFGPSIGRYLSALLEMSLERRRAEHEAKIKLIKGLD
jgi:hypothetical protein